MEFEKAEVHVKQIKELYEKARTLVVRVAMLTAGEKSRVGEGRHSSQCAQQPQGQDPECGRLRLRLDEQGAPAYLE